MRAIVGHALKRIKRIKIMPPSRKSSSSHSSRSGSRLHSSSGRSSGSGSSRHSSSSHSSSSYRSFGYSGYRRSGSSLTSGDGALYITRVRTNQPSNVPKEIQSRAIRMQCRRHDYVFYDTQWQDEKSDKVYQRGYYDEEGKYYSADDIAFKKQDGTFVARYICNYCSAEAEYIWKEGFLPVCKKCGAQMEKQPVFVDEIVNMEPYMSSVKEDKPIKVRNVFKSFIPVLIWVLFVGFIINYYFALMNGETAGFFRGTQSEEEQVSNLDIYGKQIYLKEVDENIYVICDSGETYDKELEWDYGADSYYDYESNCYLWYNTDVSPNLWQYWYEDIVGDSYYGWMECEGDAWYIEVSDTEWEEYTGDTSSLWHIQNRFDD